MALLNQHHCGQEHRGTAMGLLKTCMDDLKISQKAVSAGIGWSRTVVNHFVNQGRMPVDAERFRAGLRRYIEQNQPVMAWLNSRGAEIDEIFDIPLPLADLEDELVNVIGWTALTGPRTETVNRLARVSLYLLDCLRQTTETADIETEAAVMLGRRMN